MLVFQLLLFGGYAYAHLISKYLRPKQQALLHTALLICAIATLPIAPSVDWKPTGSDEPVSRIMLLLSACIGLPYFLLSSTSPLVQSWFSRTHSGQSPYRLYSLSNIGSLLALLSYPFIFEPALSTGEQSQLWSLAFIGFTLLCTCSGWYMFRQSRLVDTVATIKQPEVQLVVPTWPTRAIWFALSATASILLLATTNQVCLDVAVIPFLWVLPLALYLITFILCFDSQRWYRRRVYTTLAALLLAGELFLVTQGSDVSILLQIGIYFGAMFSCCMVCHGELAAMKPDPRFLTNYFLTSSAGGAAGGLFVGLIAPQLFVNYNELHFGIISFMLLFLVIRLREDNVRLPVPTRLQLPLAGAVLALVLVGLSQVGRHQAGVEAVARNFYGVLKVHVIAEKAGEIRQLAHGRIAHGSQFCAPEKRSVPTAYYAPNTGIGLLLSRYQTNSSRHIGIVGLGVGTLAAYGNPDDRIRMYEINPDVIRLAEKHFTFLSDCPSQCEMVQGDARLSLEFEPDQQFDVLVIDAFSGDAIPVHLLTREAVEVYLRHLKPDGVLACHISNLHFNLKPVIAGLGNEFDLKSCFVGNVADVQSAGLPAEWALLSRSPEFLNCIDRGAIKPPARFITWTDNRSNLLEVLQ